MSLVVRPAAAADLEDAFLWYEGQTEGLGDEFLAAVEKVLGTLLESPRLYRIVYRDTRTSGVFRIASSIGLLGKMLL